MNLIKLFHNWKFGEHGPTNVRQLANRIARGEHWEIDLGKLRDNELISNNMYIRMKAANEINKDFPIIG